MADHRHIKPVADLPVLPGIGDGAGDGRVTAAVKVELGLVGAAAQRRPALAEGALTMARAIDTPCLAAMAPDAFEQLVAALDRLWAGVEDS